MLEPNGTRDRFSTLSPVEARRPPRVARLSVLAVVSLTLVGCDAKLPEFFEPVVEGPVIDFPSAAAIEGTYLVDYEVISTTCESSLPDFSVPADIETDPASKGGSPLRIYFPDAPVPISGLYFDETGEYDGSTGPVDIGGGAFADETYSVDFRLSASDLVTFSGFSDVPVTQGGSEVCRREFRVSGTRTGMLP